MNTKTSVPQGASDSEDGSDQMIFWNLLIMLFAIAAMIFSSYMNGRSKAAASTESVAEISKTVDATAWIQCMDVTLPDHSSPKLALRKRLENGKPITNELIAELEYAVRSCNHQIKKQVAAMNAVSEQKAIIRQ